MLYEGEYEYKGKLQTQELISDSSYNKACFLDFPHHIIYHLIIEYFKYNKSWSLNGSHYKDLSFIFDKVEIIKNNQNGFLNYLNDSNFYTNYYEQSDLSTLNSIIGYQSVFIGTFFYKQDINSFEDLKYLEQVIQYLISNNHKIYYLIPDLIFQPSSETYNENSPTNTESDYSYISRLRFVDQFLQYLRFVKKLPIYRIIIPNVWNDTNLRYFVQDKLEKAKTKFDIDSISRPFLFSEQFSYYLFKIFEEQESKNYLISSYYSISEDELFDIDLTTLNTHSKPIIKTSMEFNYKYNAIEKSLNYNDAIKRLLNLKKSFNLRTFQKEISKNKNKYLK